MKKLTQKEKLMEAFIFAQTIKSSAKELDYISNDDDYREGVRIAKEISDKVTEFLAKIK